MYEFADFLKMTIAMMAINAKNSKQLYIGWIRKNPEIHPTYHFCDFPQKCQFRLKMKISKFLGMHPTYH